MNDGMNQPHNPSRGGKPRRRRRNFGSNPTQGGQGGQNGQQNQSRSGGQGRNNRNNRNNRGPRRTQVFVGPMDHSYRATLGGNNGSRPGRMRPGFAPAYAPLEPEPLPQGDNGNSRIFAFVDDLFFQAKIQETARKLNVKVEFVKTEKDLLDHMKLNGEEKPSLIIFDMNNANAKPLTLIPKLKTKLKKGTSIIGFLSHVQGDLKMKAHEVGCDMVLPRSAFSQNLPQLLRRHGAPEAEATN